MKKLWMVCGLMLAALFASHPAQAQQPGDDATDFNFDKAWNAPEGAEKLSDYRGKVVLLYFWATW